MGLKCLFGHKWNGCKCFRCGKKRDEQHNWNFCKGTCNRCGKFCYEQHDWNGYKCSKCGKKKNVDLINDQSLLADIAKNDNDLVLRYKAAAKLADEALKQEIYADINAKTSMKDLKIAFNTYVDIIIDELTTSMLKENIPFNRTLRLNIINRILITKQSAELYWPFRCDEEIKQDMDHIRKWIENQKE